MAASYFVAVSALLFSGFSALMLINAVRHLDPAAPWSEPESLEAASTQAVVAASAV